MATIDVTEETFEATVTGEGLVLVDCLAAWCGPCRQFGPVFEKVSNKHPDVVFAKLDTEHNQSIAAALEITSIPTLLVFRDGILIHRQSGSLPVAALEDLVSQAQALDMDEVRRQIEAENNPPEPTKRF